MPSVHYLCQQCGWRLESSPEESTQGCFHCDQSTSVIAPPDGAEIETCAACGHDEIYVQKDFNRTTGIALVVIGAIFVPWTWGLSLLAVTILDFVVYYLVGDVIVCYACRAVHRGYPRHERLRPFDLAVHDRHVYGAAPPGAEEGHR